MDMESSFYEHTARKWAWQQPRNVAQQGEQLAYNQRCRWFESIRSNFSIAEKLLTSYIF